VAPLKLNNNPPIAGPVTIEKWKLELRHVAAFP
jgi:hypothetical protein